jgi:hypothetical protein
MSANSVLPPQDGMAWSDKIDHLAGTALNELSECQSRSASLNIYARLSGGRGLPAPSRFEKSAIPREHKDLWGLLDSKRPFGRRLSSRHSMDPRDPYAPRDDQGKAWVPSGSDSW